MSIEFWQNWNRLWRWVTLSLRAHGETSVILCERVSGMPPIYTSLQEQDNYCIYSFATAVIIVAVSNEQEQSCLLSSLCGGGGVCVFVCVCARVRVCVGGEIFWLPARIDSDLPLSELSVWILLSQITSPQWSLSVIESVLPAVISQRGWVTSHHRKQKKRLCCTTLNPRKAFRNMELFIFSIKQRHKQNSS